MQLQINNADGYIRSRLTVSAHPVIFLQNYNSMSEIVHPIIPGHNNIYLTVESLLLKTDVMLFSFIPNVW
jgi:hypothetical protein